MTFQIVDQWPDPFPPEGYLLSQSLGCPLGLSADLYSCGDSSQPKFLVVFKTACERVLLEPDGWIGLIDLLAKLAPICLAGMSYDTEEIPDGPKYAIPVFRVRPPRSASCDPTSGSR